MKNISVTPPKWLTQSAIYQINPRTFSPEGTIGAITKELDYLKSVGFNIVYLCPIFTEDDSNDKSCWSDRQIKSETNNPKNPYRMNDYFTIDSEYGTQEDLQELIKEAHSRDMKVILDLVYAHIGPNAPIIKRHPEFVKQDENGNMLYTEWHFPALDFTSEGLREYLYCNMVYYIGVLDADGFRCDVGDSVPVDFWYEARSRMRKIKSDAALINEGTEFEKLKNVFDSSYFYDWHETLYKIFCGGESAALIRTQDEDVVRKRPSGSLLLRDIDNHDTVSDWPERTEKAAGNDGMEQIEVINYMIDGIPMVYCGNEIACDAKLSMFANRFFPGKYETTDRDRKDTPAAKRRESVMKKLNKMKMENEVLLYGKTTWLDNSDPESVISFERKFNESKIIFVGNTKKESKVLKLDVIANANVLLSNNFELHENEIKLGKRGYAVFSL